MVKQLKKKTLAALTEVPSIHVVHNNHEPVTGSLAFSLLTTIGTRDCAMKPLKLCSKRNISSF